MADISDERRLDAVRELVSQLREQFDINASVKLWDGSLVPLGREVTSQLAITIDSPGVLSSLIRWPSLDRLIQHYAHGRIGIEGGTLIDLGEKFAFKKSGSKLKKLNKRRALGALLPLLFTPAEKPGSTLGFKGDQVGARREKSDNAAFVAFHYDLSNEFYDLFLDPNMVYSCAYFTDWNNSLEQAQQDKLEIICRKLRLRKGERFLDIGCGWGGLVCYAAKNFGVHAHGISLSKEQLAYAEGMIKSLGLEEQVTVEFKSYANLTGTYDKIASIGMAEHIGVANMADYLRIIRSALAKDGLFLNHAISRRGKKRKRKFSKRAEQRALIKYIFPGGELDDLGNTIAAMEAQGFEVHDVEAWREHYQLTTRHWCERLTAKKEEAIALVGEQTYRIWVAYLAGCSLAFSRGTARIYQTLASRSAKGSSPLPPTRADLYK